MNKVHRFDSDGFYVEDVILKEDEPMPADCTDVDLPQGIYLPAKFENGQWTSIATQDEINAMHNPDPKPVEMDGLQQQLADLTYTLMMNGVL